VPRITDLPRDRGVLKEQLPSAHLPCRPRPDGRRRVGRPDERVSTTANIHLAATTSLNPLLIPTANTTIVPVPICSDLAQLVQIRGRVADPKTRALFAYLTTKPRAKAEPPLPKNACWCWAASTVGSGLYVCVTGSGYFVGRQPAGEEQIRQMAIVGFELCTNPC